MAFRHGRCVARLIHCLQACQIGHYGLSERAIFDGNLVKDGQNGPVFATYQWECETDTPHFTFYPQNYPDCDLPSFKEYERKQFYIKPYIDDLEMQNSIAYIVQEAKKVVSLNEALNIREIRDLRFGEWQHITSDTIHNITYAILEGTHRKVLSRVESLWRHVAMCMIFDMQKTPQMHLPWLHEAKKVVHQLTLYEAEQIMFVRDHFGGDWTGPVGLEDLIKKLQAIDNENWKSLAMDAVSNIKMR